jgi:hypothetical protein
VLVQRNGSVTFNPLANDVAPTGWTLALDDTRTPHGQVQRTPGTGQLTYTPTPGTNAGTDQFSYRLQPPIIFFSPTERGSTRGRIGVDRGRRPGRSRPCWACSGTCCPGRPGPPPPLTRPRN